MNIEERLRQLKRITPKTDYTERSRSFILGSSQEPARPRLTLWQFVMQNVQFGSAIALTGLLLLLGFGGFSAWKFISPFGLSSLDPANLRAEAEVVNDIGVALNSIQYIPTEPAQSAKLGARMAKPDVMTMSAMTPVIDVTEPTNVTTTEEMAVGDSTTYGEGIASTTKPDFSTTTVDEALDFLLE